MKRYEDWGDLGMREAPDGDWVRYEDVAELERKLNLAVAASGHKAQLLNESQAAAKASHAELEALKARASRAVAVLSTPGTWSEFAARALKELRG